MRLLLAEDEEEMSNALTKILKSNNYSVDAVNNGDDALDYIESEIYDGAILDIMMPGLSGIEVLKEARKDGIKTPVLLLTAKSEIDDKVEGLDAGADDYLTKPFSMKELLARVRALVRRKEEVVDSKLEFGNVKLDRLTYEISTPGGSQKLGNKDFQMLEMLIEHPGQVISIDQFMDKIWGYDYIGDTRTVDVHVKRVREKIKDGSNWSIATVWGIGYKFEVK